ncbi:hypothetical protein A3F66_01575 [candidate division TM6 bacterium RIFCSPHIGHO2_12_FULL_32_22]|nr:MAG: hypothetical protein A3F66_01575 [candidate division TM6 bacterium RIFCSPHIGHO2_12_FULL_32_22]
MKKYSIFLRSLGLFVCQIYAVNNYNGQTQSNSEAEDKQHPGLLSYSNGQTQTKAECKDFWYTDWGCTSGQNKGQCPGFWYDRWGCMIPKDACYQYPGWRPNGKTKSECAGIGEWHDECGCMVLNEACNKYITREPNDKTKSECTAADERWYDDCGCMVRKPGSRSKFLI